MRVVGTDLQALLSGDQVQCFVALSTSGTGAAPHCHSRDEAFFVIRRPVVFGVGDQEHPIDAGTLGHGPGGPLPSRWTRQEVRYPCPGLSR